MKSHINENKESWNEFYEVRPRLKYPDLIFVHFLMKYVLNQDPKISNAIAIGAGDGAQSFAVAQNGVPITCTDISEVSIERLKKFSKDDGIDNLVTVEKANQIDLSQFKDESFDLAISWSVISYLTVDEGQKAIDEIHRILKPNGHFIGLLESLNHTGYKQEGVEQTGDRTFIMPKTPKQSVSNVMMTYYSRSDVDTALHGFKDTTLCHRNLEWVTNNQHSVGQWMFHTRKK